MQPSAERLASIRTAVFTAILCLGLAAPASAGPDDPKATAEAELADLGATLKAAVLSGAVSEDDAMEIYDAWLERLAATFEPKPRTKASRFPASPKFDRMRLAAMMPEQIDLLLAPEFRSRDLALLRDELDLDDDQLVITESLFRDYVEAFELAGAPFRDALARREQAALDRRLADALGRVHIEDVDQAVATLREKFGRKAVRRPARRERVGEGEVDAKTDASNLTKKNASRDNWTERMLDAAADMDVRLASLRTRVQAELDALERDGREIAGRDLLRLGRSLRRERAELRAEVIDALHVIVTPAQAGPDGARLRFALARIRTLHALPRWRLGGEGMDLWDAYAQVMTDRDPTGEDDDVRPDLRVLLREGEITTAARLDARAEATLDRELAGLRFQAAVDAHAPGESGSASAANRDALPNPGVALEAFAGAARREINAAIAVRDGILTRLERSAERLIEHDEAALATAFRDTALAQGFRVPMRRRWAERALTEVHRRDDLDDHQHRALINLADTTHADLRALRAEVIRDRIERDARRARDLIEIQLGFDERRIEFPDDFWDGIGFRRFDAIDDRTEDQLRTILTQEQFTELPARLRKARRKNTTTAPAKPRPAPGTKRADD